MRKCLLGLILLASVAGLSGCGGGAGSLLGGGCSPHNYSLTFPSTSGYSTSGSITSATACFSSATVSTYASTLPILGVPYTPSGPSPQILLYLGLTFSANEYASGLPALTVTLPSGVTTANRQFYLAYNGGGGGALGWLTNVVGPVTASGSTVSFPSGGGNTTFDANQEAEFAVYSVAGT